MLAFRPGKHLLSLIETRFGELGSFLKLRFLGTQSAFVLLRYELSMMLLVCKIRLRALSLPSLGNVLRPDVPCNVKLPALQAADIAMG